MTENPRTYHLLIVSVVAFIFPIICLLIAWVISADYTNSEPRAAALLFFCLVLSCLVGGVYTYISVKGLIKSEKEDSRGYGGLITSTALMSLGTMLALLTLKYLADHLFGSLNESLLLVLATVSLLVWWTGIWFLAAWLFEKTPTRTVAELLSVVVLSIQAILGVIWTYCVFFVR